jgi:hypothetical protein
VQQRSAELLTAEIATDMSVFPPPGAVKHQMLCACWHMLSTGELYADLGGDYYAVTPHARPSASSPSSSA